MYSRGSRPQEHCLWFDRCCQYDLLIHDICLHHLLNRYTILEGPRFKIWYCGKCPPRSPACFGADALAPLRPISSIPPLQYDIHTHWVRFMISLLPGCRSRFLPSRHPLPTPISAPPSHSPTRPVILSPCLRPSYPPPHSRVSPAPAPAFPYSNPLTPPRASPHPPPRSSNTSSHSVPAPDSPCSHSSPSPLHGVLILKASGPRRGILDARSFVVLCLARRWGCGRDGDF